MSILSRFSDKAKLSRFSPEANRYTIINGSEKVNSKLLSKMKREHKRAELPNSIHIMFKNVTEKSANVSYNTVKYCYDPIKGNWSEYTEVLNLDISIK